MQRGVVIYPALVGVRLTREQAAKLNQLAAADDRPAGTLARRLLGEALDQIDIPREVQMA